jgi:hypothetical protein
MVLKNLFQLFFVEQNQKILDETAGQKQDKDKDRSPQLPPTLPNGVKVQTYVPRDPKASIIPLKVQK